MNINKISSVIIALMMPFGLMANPVTTKTSDDELLNGIDKEEAFSIKQPSETLELTISGVTDNVSVEDDEESITLVGSVPTKEDKMLLEKLYSEMSDEKMLINELDVVSSSE